MPMRYRPCAFMRMAILGSIGPPGPPCPGPGPMLDPMGPPCPPWLLLYIPDCCIIPGDPMGGITAPGGKPGLPGAPGGMDPAEWGPPAVVVVELLLVGLLLLLGNLAPGGGCCCCCDDIGG